MLSFYFSDSSRVLWGKVIGTFLGDFVFRCMRKENALLLNCFSLLTVVVGLRM